MPDELASEAGAGGSFLRSVSNAASCASFASWSGSSAQARWLITSPTAIPSQGARHRREALDIGRRQAEPRHAAVDLQRRVEPPAGAFGRLAPGFDLLDAVEHRNGAGRHALVLGARLYAVQHLNRRCVAERCAQRDRFGEMRHEEKCAALGAAAPPPLRRLPGHSRRP